MYIPAHFREDDLARLHGFLRENSFGTLITCRERVPFATHLPFLLDTAQGAFGTLRGHLARANPQWQSFDTQEEALAIFQGPHAYISPSWYATEPNVPTWNYAAVHAYGFPHLLDDEALYETLRASVHSYEDSRPQPWRFESLPEAYVRKMMRGIVGFAMEITRIEGKWKMSQNRSEEDRARVIDALHLSEETTQAQVAETIRAVDP